MNRRQYLALTGVTTGALAGCLSGSDDETDDDAGDANGAETEDWPSGNELGADPGAYPKYEVGGETVPLVPVADTYDWYEQGALFLDATDETQHEHVRIEGSKLSPPNQPEFDHPTEGLEADRLIVTYCVCPHTLAGARGAELVADGFEHVYAIDEGLEGWRDEGYPLAGSEASVDLASYTVAGRTDPASAGEQVWLEAPETGQRYAGRIDDDGRFELSFEFADVDDDTVVRLDLPDGSVERPLGELAAQETEF